VCDDARRTVQKADGCVLVIEIASFLSNSEDRLNKSIIKILVSDYLNASKSSSHVSTMLGLPLELILRRGRTDAWHTA